MFNPLKIFKRKKANDFQKVFLNSSNSITGQDSTSFAAIDLICNSIANLSCAFYDSESKQIIKDFYLYDLINNPNIDETKFQFFYNSVKDYINGNVYWYKYDSDGEIVSLFRLNPNSVKVKRDSFNQKIFTYNGVEYTSEKILHIPSRYGYNGLIGKSIFDECNNIFNTSLELDEFIKNSFDNNIGNRLIIDITKEYPNATEEQIEQLKNKFRQNYTGI